MITAQPGTLFEATVEGLADDLIGILTWRVEDGQGHVVLPAISTSIVSSGIGIYTGTRTSPTARGDYLLVWNDGSGNEASEDLEVTYDLPVYNDPVDWPDNVLRSLRAWISDLMGSPPWIVRTEDRETTARARPQVTVLALGGVQTIFARAARPQGDITRMRPFSVQAFPPVGADDTPRDCNMAAEEVVRTLRDALDFGVVQAGLTERQQAAPGYVPLWDFTDVPIDGPAASRKRPATPYAFARIQAGATVDKIPDPQDPKLFTVAMDVRLEWDQPGRVAIDADQLATGGLSGGFVPPGP